MKYIRDYNSFKNNNKVNEEFLGAIAKFFGNLYNKSKQKMAKIKGSQEIQVVFDKYLKIINTQLSKTADIDLNLSAAADTTPTKESLLTEADAIGDIPKIDGKESDDLGKESPAEQKMDVDKLKQKKTIMEQIVKKNVEMAKKEMNNILTKYGGSAKNPQLAVVVDNMINQFDLEYMNAQLRYLDKAGDKTLVGPIQKQRDIIMKKLDKSWNEIEKATAGFDYNGKKYPIGDVLYRYKSNDGIRVVKLVKIDEKDPKKVIAKYVDGKEGEGTIGKEQSFDLEKVDFDFNPKVNDKYMYWSNNNQSKIEVEVLAEPDEKGLTKVKTGETEFKVYSGGLIDIKEGQDKPEGQGQDKPEE